MTDLITTRFPHHPEKVPAELKVGDFWVTCDEYKVPLIAIENGAVFAASSTNPETWRSYETALATWQENDHITGLGRVICDDEDYVGVDLDDCLDPAAGELAPWAATIVDRLDSYAEISPSLTGVKIWVRAPELRTAYKKPGIEIYPRGRYFTVTGRLLGGKFVPLSLRGDELAAIIEEEFPKVDRDYTPYETVRIGSWISTSSWSVPTSRFLRSRLTAPPSASTGSGAPGSTSTAVATKAALIPASTKTVLSSLTVGTLTAHAARGGSFATTSKR